jgi:hypothetical protein
MLVSAGEFTVEVHEWGTHEAAMLDALASWGGGSIVLGSSPDRARYYTAQFQRQSGVGRERFGVGVAAEWHGVYPQLMLDASGPQLFGFDRNVVGVSLNDRRVTFVRDLGRGHLFSGFIPVPDRELTVIVTEIGVVAMGQGGTELARFERDLLRSYSLDGSKLHLDFGDPSSVDLELDSPKTWKEH